jgi:hypothetical protein
MDGRSVWLLLAALCAVGVIAIIRIRSKPGSPTPAAEAVEVPVPATPVAAVARTCFADGGGYVEIDGVVCWASADPESMILPGQVLDHEPSGDGHTAMVALAHHSARKEDRA